MSTLVFTLEWTFLNLQTHSYLSTLPLLIHTRVDSMKNTITGYVRVSDSNKANAETQRSAIESYAERNNLKLAGIVEEHISASKTNLEERKLNILINSNCDIVVSDISRIGRNKVLELIGTIGSIARNGALHLAYDDRVIDSGNVDDAETIFTVVGQSFASAAEAKKRSDRAIAGHAKRKSQGLQIGRKPGQVVKSKLDNHLAFILHHQGIGTKVGKLLELLVIERGVKVSRSGYYKWLKLRQLTGNTNNIEITTNTESIDITK